MNGREKLTANHVARKALVYVRQSSVAQVRHNTESQALQYALEGVARQLGFVSVEIVDHDLGISGSGQQRRPGFEVVLSQVALGKVGLVMSREVSRLSRSDKDFCQLLELCQAFDTLVGDADSLYDLSTMDDALVLGIKGTLSVVELKVLRQRLIAGREHKAKRGAYYNRLPAGYVLDRCGDPVKDPNQRVRDGIAQIFDVFEQTWSMRQTFMWFVEREIALPVTVAADDCIRTIFQIPKHGFIVGVLKNPFYAGAYVYGRRGSDVVFSDGRIKKRTTRMLPAEASRVFIRDHHQGYISWETFERHQRMIENNAADTTSDATTRALRQGKALLCGLLRCGVCGRKLSVRYWGRRGLYPYYLCSGSYPGGGSRYCFSVGGIRVDERVGQEVIRLAGPVGIEASVAAAQHALGGANRHQQQLQNAIRQLRYDAQRAFEQYDEVDPRNRLVADTLEQRWNDKLTALQAQQDKLATLVEHQRPLTDKQRARLDFLGRHVSEVWNSPHCPTKTKKKILRTMFKEIMIRDVDETTLQLVCHFAGGHHAVIEMPRPLSGAKQKNDSQAIDVIAQMAQVNYGDDDIACVLNKMGKTTGNGNRWTRGRVKAARGRNKISGTATTRPRQGILSLAKASAYAQVSDTTIKKLVTAGLLSMHQLFAYAPWEIRQQDLDRPAVVAILAHLKRTGKLVLDLGESSTKQTHLFE